MTGQLRLASVFDNRSRSIAEALKALDGAVAAYPPAMHVRSARAQIRAAVAKAASESRRP
jgi:hypothetical protein